MKHQNQMKMLKLAAILLVGSLCLLGELRNSADANQERPGRLFEIVGMDAPLDKRFGPDDAAAFVIHFSGDTHGSLDTCG